MRLLLLFSSLFILLFVACNDIGYNFKFDTNKINGTDSVTDTDSTTDINIPTDIIYIYDTDSNIDTVVVIVDGDTSTSSDTDTVEEPFWVPEGPKQLGLGYMFLECDTDVIITEDGDYWECDEAPVPCIPDEPKVNCNAVIKDEDGQTVYDGLVGIERRGRSSINYPKPNYSLEFRNADESDNPVPCMGMGKEADWVLDGSWLDRSFIRNDLISDIFSEVEGHTHYGPDSRFIELDFNGESQGIYRLVEKIKRDDDRINIPKDDGSGSSFVVKHDDDGEIFVDLGLEQNTWSIVYPSDKKISTQQQSAIESWLTEFATALNSSNAFAYLNMENVVDYVLMQEFSKNIDGYQYSLYLFKEPGQLANFVPWDYDLSFGQPAVAYAEAQGDPPNESTEGWVLHHTNLIERFLDDETFRARLVERWAQLRTGPLSDEAVNTRIDEYLLVLNGAAIQNNFSVWPMTDVSFSHIYSVYSLYDMDSYDAEIAKLRQWISQRMSWMDVNLPSFN